MGRSHRHTPECVQSPFKLQLRLRNPYDLFGHYLAGSRELSEFPAGAPLNRDDRPHGVFQAPRFPYADSQPAHVRLPALVDRFQPEPEEVLAQAEANPQRHEAKWLFDQMFRQEPTAEVISVYSLSYATGERLRRAN